MKEFIFRNGSLEKQGLQEGDKVKCTYNSSSVDYFTVGKTYPVGLFDNALCLFDDDGDPYDGLYCSTVRLEIVSKKTKHSDFKDALDYLDTFGIPAEVTDKGMHIEGELTKVQWLDFAQILLEGEE